nr:hypothetical protein [Tanacetum cinerariifolium]
MTKKEGPEGAEPGIIHNEEPVPRPSIFYQPSKSSNLSFPSSVKKQKNNNKDKRLLLIFKHIYINMPFLKAMIYMPKGAKVLKELLSHMGKLEKAASTVKLSEECSAIIQRSLPQKEGDPRRFILPCLIGPLAVKNALADLGGKLSLRLESETVTFNFGKSMKAKHSRYDYLYCTDHITKIVQEQWVDMVDHNGKWTEVGEEEDFNKVQAVSFHPRTELVEPLEWKALENRLKPSRFEQRKLEMKESPEQLKYAFLQENNQLPIVISSALSTVEKSKLLKVLKNHKGAIAWSISDIKWIDSSLCTHKILMEDEFKLSVQP